MAVDERYGCYVSKLKGGWWRRKPDLTTDEALLARAIHAGDFSCAAEWDAERILDALTALSNKGYLDGEQFTESLTRLLEGGYVALHFSDFSVGPDED